MDNSALRESGCTSEFCPEHSGQRERLKGLDGKMNLLIWICGVGMSLNLLVIGGSASYIIGGLTAQGHQITLLKDRQDRIINEIQRIQEDIRTSDRRIDGLEKVKPK